MRGQHAAPADYIRWKTAVLAVAAWIAGVWLWLVSAVAAVFTVTVTAARRRISGPPPAHANPRR